VAAAAWNKDYLTTIVAVFGTTISPYLFFWQASQEVEELRRRRRPPLRRAPEQVARRSSGASVSTPWSAWAYRTWSPSSSC
jgi:Mn2+/Fe2+ NRAMP family transporter